MFCQEKTVFLIILNFLKLVSSVSAFIIPPEIILYDGLNQSGNPLTVRSAYIPNLESKHFDDRVQSICLNGTWLLFENPNFNEDLGGVEYFSGLSFCSNLKTLRQKISSLRFVGSPSDTESDSITFYSELYFQGQEEFFGDGYHDDILDVLKNHTKSLIVTGSSGWTFFDGANHEGTSFCVQPKTEPNSTSVLFVYNLQSESVSNGSSGSIGSFKQGCSKQL